MDKRWIILLLILIFVIPVAYSLTSFVVEETEFIAVEPSFEDPDGDILDYTYSEPLNKDGEWQTSYGDAGEYDVSIMASDGDLVTEEEVLITVTKREEVPEIIAVIPEDEVIAVKEGESVHFEAEAFDLNKDELAYEWLVDGNHIGYGVGLDYTADYFSLFQAYPFSSQINQFQKSVIFYLKH